MLLGWGMLLAMGSGRRVFPLHPGQFLWLWVFLLGLRKAEMVWRMEA